MYCFTYPSIGGVLDFHTLATFHKTLAKLTAIAKEVTAMKTLRI